MPVYYHLRHKVPNSAARLRAVGNLKKLRGQLDREVPRKDAESSLLLATWNIRDFDKRNRRGFGRRLPETWFYIAEVISRFDFVAVQEVNRLREWEHVMDILGREYDYIASDETDPRIGGNGERLLFVYDKRKVSFQNIAGEIVLPNNMLITKNMETDDDAKFVGRQFRRTPYVCTFQSRWFKFSICTVHIYFGSESGDKLAQRVQEIGKIATYFGHKADEGLREGRALILLGDFNIVHPEHKTMNALKDAGFTVPQALQEKTNFKRTKYYDQIAFKAKNDVIDFVEGQGADGKPNAGVFNPFKKIMTTADFSKYSADAKASKNGKTKTGNALKKYYTDWKTYQISDHFPLWARIDVNASAAYLDRMEKDLRDRLG